MAYSNEVNLFFPGFDRNTIPVFNAGTVLIPAYSAVAVSEARQSENNWQLCVVPAISDDGIWGIAAGNIHPGTWGNMVISGVARAWIAHGSGNYVTPSPAGLAGAASGKAQILCRGNENVPGVVVLGYSGSANNYYGQFAIRHLGERTFEIYGGWTDEYAGTTDLPGADLIPVQTVTLPEERSLDRIMLYACHDGNAYSAVIQLRSLDSPQGYFDYVELGMIYADGTVGQTYRDDTGNGVQFGRRWFL